MSELTKCNYCNLKEMKSQAKKRGTKVFVILETEGEWKGWLTVYYKDKQVHSARFMALTDHCVC
jgi:hypothetical protein